MKKLTYLLFLAVGVMGCSADALNEDLLVADAKVKVQNVEKFNAPAAICAGVPAQFSFEAALGTNLQVQQKVNGDWVQVYQISQSTSNPQIFELSFSEAGTYALRYKIGNGGFTETTVTVINCGCEESFTYVMNSNGSYTFTYVPAEDMDNAEVVFTFAQSVVVSGLQGWTSNGVTMQSRIDLDACEVYTWTVGLNTDCNGRGQKEANLWTDFKVNDDSKKHEGTPNIEKSC
ncbi:hypothetical protein BH23BAC2_BH23BAC2_21850 [soil metagenome]